MLKIAILVYPGMTALDAIGPYEVFNATRAFDIQFVWKEIGPIVTDSGRLVLGATHALADVQAADLVLVPGSSTDTLTEMADQAVLNWLRAVDRTTRYTTSVCTGALILGAAGLLRGHPATTHWLGMPALQTFGATALPNERIVRSGKLVTAAGVSAGIDLALYLTAELLGAEAAQAAQLSIEYDPQPPFDAGHLSKADPAVVRRARADLAKLAVLNPRNLVSLPAFVVQRWMRVLQRSK
jgi:transcriptional regulator GlxA family with amidase domain